MKTKMKKTSLDAYLELVSTGKSHSQKAIILKSISRNGSSLKEISHRTGLEINAVSGRVNDLKKQGLLVEGRKRPCTITRRLITPVHLNDESNWKKSIFEDRLEHKL